MPSFSAKAFLKEGKGALVGGGVGVGGGGGGGGKKAPSPRNRPFPSAPPPPPPPPPRKEEKKKWVQCDACTKWRRVPTHIEIQSLPDVWHCHMASW